MVLIRGAFCPLLILCVCVCVSVHTVGGIFSIHLFRFSLWSWTKACAAPHLRYNSLCHTYSQHPLLSLSTLDSRRSYVPVKTSRDVPSTSAPPPPPPPPPPTTHTYCTSRGRETRRESVEGGVEGDRERKNKSKSHKLLEMSLLRREKRREGQQKTKSQQSHLAAMLPLGVFNEKQ